jgi:hypothetical protein
MKVWCPLALGLAVALGSACGGDDAGNGAGDAQPAPGATVFVPGKFDELPDAPWMAPLSDVQRYEGVTVRTFAVDGARPALVGAEYGELLERAGWRVESPLRAVGDDSVQSVWRDDEDFHLVVTVARRATGQTDAGRGRGDDADISDTARRAGLQLSIEMYEPGTPPSTAPATTASATAVPGG